MPLSTTNHANNRKTLPLFLTDYAARKCLIQQLITELGVSYINKASDALIDVGTAKIRHAVLGDDKVNIVAGEADGSTALELADDLGDLVALTGGLVLDHGSGVQSDDGASALTHLCADGGVRLPAGTGELTGADGLGGTLPGKIYLEACVDGYLIVVLRYNVGIVDPCAVIEGNTGVAVAELV